MFIYVYENQNKFYHKSLTCYIDVFMKCCILDIRMEDFVYEKLDKKKRDRVNHHEVLGHVLVDGGNDFGPGTTYGECGKSS